MTVPSPPDYARADGAFEYAHALRTQALVHALLWRRARRLVLEGALVPFWLAEGVVG